MKHAPVLSAPISDVGDDFTIAGFWVGHKQFRFPPTHVPQNVTKHPVPPVNGKAVTKADRRHVTIAFGANSSLRKHGKARHR